MTATRQARRDRPPMEGDVRELATAGKSAELGPHSRSVADARWNPEVDVE